MLKYLQLNRYLVLVILISVVPFILNLFGVDFTSRAVSLSSSADNLAQVSQDDQFYALTGALHHALLEWSAVTLALVAGFVSFVHYSRYKDVSVPIIGLALLCAGFTDAFHTLAATRVISANVPNTDFIPFTWAFSRIFNATLMIAGVSISLWLTRHSLFGIKPITTKTLDIDRYQTKILMLVSLVFISLAIGSVILAATSDQLPKTTFANALITRPYDVLPLALFTFSASLVFGWYQRQPTILKFALLLSIIPEIATQLHMSFGSTALYDNHFNIAHGLKIFAYAILTIGLLTSLLEKKTGRITGFEMEVVSTEAFENTRIDRKVPQPIKRELLEVGTAKYSQVFLFSSFTFVLSIVITLLVASVFYVDTVSLAKEQQLQQLKTDGDLIEPLIKGIYTRTENEIKFLSRTPPIQTIIQSLKKNDQKNYRSSVARLKKLFEGKIKYESNYKKISYIQFTDASKSKELIHTYRKNRDVYSMPDSMLTEIKDNQYLKNNLTLAGQTVFYNSSLIGESQLVSESTLNIILPIEDIQTGEIFGAITLDVDFGQFIKELELSLNSGQLIYLADSKGTIVFRTDSQRENLDSLSDPKTLQIIFPGLVAAIEADVNSFQMGISLSEQQQYDAETTSSGHYRTMYLQPSNHSNIMRMFIQLDEQALEVQLTTFRFRSLMLGFGLSIVSLSLAIMIGRKLTAPLQQTTQALIRYGYTGKIDDLPIDANDETGVLARSFHNLLAIKAAQEIELLRQKSAMDEHSIVSITDVQGTILYVNEKFIAISGYSRQELIGENHRILNSGFHGIQFFRDMYHEIAHGNVWQDDICNKTKDGRLYWVNSTMVPFMGSDGKPESYVSIRTDITESKNNAKKLAIARDELSYRILKLQEANAELDQFAYVASHDLKSPLNGIKQLVSWIEEDCRDILPEDSKQNLDLLKSRTQRMGNLLNDLLDYSRVGRQQHEPETVYLSALVDDVFELQGNREGFTCLAPNAPVLLQKTPFELVMRNLISNALKHHDKKSGEIKITLDQDDNMYTIRVQDDGPGIPPNLHGKAIEMFQTLQSRDKTEGSGMGLALVNKTVNHHGGNLQIDSNGERGTGIIVKWPKVKQSSKSFHEHKDNQNLFQRTI